MRQLLTHTSGLRPELPLYDCRGRRGAARAAARRGAGWPAPGGAYAYSDLNLLLLQQVLERHHPARAWTSSSGTASPAAGHDVAPPSGPAPGRGGDGGPAAAVGQGGPGDAAGRGPRRERLGAGRGRRARGSLLHGAATWRCFCRTLLGGGAYGTARILGPDSVELLLDPARPRLRRRPALVHGRVGGARRGGPHRLHRYVAGPGPGHGHVPGAPGQHRPPAPPARGQRRPGRPRRTRLARAVARAGERRHRRRARSGGSARGTPAGATHGSLAARQERLVPAP